MKEKDNKEARDRDVDWKSNVGRNKEKSIEKRRDGERKDRDRERDRERGREIERKGGIERKIEKLREIGRD